jgi:hypothetical protein
MTETVYAIVIAGAAVEVFDYAGFQTVDAAGTRWTHLPGWRAKYSDVELATYGIFSRGVPSAPPGQIETARTLSVEDGVPVLSVTHAYPPTDQIEMAECAAIDAERDARQQADFLFDFEATAALDDAGTEIAAGVRALQMRREDQDNWTRLHALAMAAALGGAPDTILPMRAEDNWNIQTTAAQVMAAFAAGSQRNATLLFFAGALKSAVRAALAADDVPAALAIRPNAAWPA